MGGLFGGSKSSKDPNDGKMTYTAPKDTTTTDTTYLKDDSGVYTAAGTDTTVGTEATGSLTSGLTGQYAKPIPYR